jgi:hypothetical protein
VTGPPSARPAPLQPKPRPMVSGWGVLGILALLVVAGAALFGGAVAYMYATDQGFGAHVTGKSCRGPLASDSANRVDLRTTFLSIDRSVYNVPDTPCSLIREGNFVEHHIRSRHTIIYESEGGDCIYDSKRGGC